MTDLNTDPRVQALLSADPFEVSSLAGAFHTVATQAQTSAAALRGANGDGTWTGAAAAAFRTQLGKLPGNLDQVQRSYGETATALDSYSSQLGPLQTSMRSILQQWQTATSNLQTASGTLTTARSNLTTVTSAPKATPTTPAVVTAHNALQNASGAVGRLTDDVSGLVGQANRVLDEFDTARGHARSTISGAVGVAPSQSWWDSVMHAVGNFMVGLAEGIGKSVWNIISFKDVIAFIDDPSWKTFGQFVKDLAVTASIVAMVAAPFAAPELAEVDVIGDAADVEEGVEDVGEGAVEGSRAGTFARGVNTWAGRSAKLLNAGQVGTDGAQGHWGAAGVDAAFLIAPNIKSGLGAAPGLVGKFDAIQGFGDRVANALPFGDAAAEASEDLAKSGAQLRLYASWGIDPDVAAKLAFEDGLPGALQGVDAADPEALRSAVMGMRNSAYQAAQNAYRYGQPAAFAFDSVAVDPTSDLIKHKLGLVPANG